MALRWGIAGAGKISNDFVNAVHIHPEKNHQVMAIAARSKENASKFAKLHNISKFYEGYEELANDKDIDVIYVGVVNTHHYNVTKLMLNHGKHVLCELPLTMNKTDTKELLDLAKEKKLFLMQGIWSRFFPVYHKLRELLDEDAIGEVLQVRVDFGYPMELEEATLGESAILDLGIYVLHLTQLVYKGLKPISIISSGNVNIYGTDDSAAAVLIYPGGRLSVISCNARIELDNIAYIYGTKGTIKIPEFWCPLTITTCNETLEYPLLLSDAEFNYLHSQGFAYEAEEVRQCIRKGLFESPFLNHDDTLEIAELMDIIRKNVFDNKSAEVK